MTFPCAKLAHATVRPARAPRTIQATALGSDRRGVPSGPHVCTFGTPGRGPRTAESAACLRRVDDVGRFVHIRHYNGPRRRSWRFGVRPGVRGQRATRPDISTRSLAHRTERYAETLDFANFHATRRDAPTSTSPRLCDTPRLVLGSSIGMVTGRGPEPVASGGAGENQQRPTANAVLAAKTPFVRRGATMASTRPGTPSGVQSRLMQYSRPAPPDGGPPGTFRCPIWRLFELTCLEAGKRPEAAQKRPCRVIFTVNSTKYRPHPLRL